MQILIVRVVSIQITMKTTIKSSIVVQMAYQLQVVYANIQFGFQNMSRKPMKHWNILLIFAYKSLHSTVHLIRVSNGKDREASDHLKESSKSYRTK